NEDDAGSILLALLKEIADAARANADEHLHQVASRDGEEWNIRLAGNRTSQQGLTGSGRSYQEHALGNAPAQLLKFLRLAQELNDLAQLFLGLVNTRDIFEGNFLLLHREQTGTALAERQRLIAAGLHLADHHKPERAEEDEGRQIEQVHRPAIA